MLGTRDRAVYQMTAKRLLVFEEEKDSMCDDEVVLWKELENLEQDVEALADSILAERDTVL